MLAVVCCTKLPEGNKYAVMNVPYFKDLWVLKRCWHIENYTENQGVKLLGVYTAEF